MNKKVFFHLKTAPFNWQTIEDLKGMKIGGTIGYTYGQEFDRAVDSGKISIDWASLDLQNFKKLVAGRIDIFPQELDVGYGIIGELPETEAARITHHPKTIIETTHHLLFSKKIKKNRRLLHVFNTGLSDLREQGKLEPFFKASRQGAYR